MHTVNTVCQNTSKRMPCCLWPTDFEICATKFHTWVEKQLVFWCYSDILYPFIGRWHCI